MADKTLSEYSIPAVANVLVGPTVNMGNANFELKTSLIMVVQVSPFCRLPSEDPQKVIMVVQVSPFCRLPSEDPQKVTCILHSHHFPLPCIKKEK
jgi:hypothetical protein